MKTVSATKLIALLLALCMLALPMFACAENGEDPIETEAKGTTAESEGETERQPTVAKTDYDKEFTAVYCADIFREGYYFIEEEKRRPGNDLDSKVYERMIAVEEYLGVKIIAENGGNYQEYTSQLKNTVTSNDDTYQLVLTHVYQDVSNLITGKYLHDFQDFDSINMEADYWNSTLMEELAVNDKMFCGYNDFCLSNCYIIGFNKQMVKDQAGAVGDLYAQVRNKEWTLEKMIQYSSLVSADNGDGKWDEQDTYGFAIFAWVPLISFQISSNIKIVEKDADGELYLSPMVDNPEKIVKLDEMLYDFVNAPSTYAYSPIEGKPGLDLKSNRVMFQTMNNFDLVTSNDSDVKIGVLPYPLWDSKQEDYQTMSWNGVMGIPSSVRTDNMKMTGDVIEMLAFYSEPVTVAFYETLLGAKVADAPEDVEMLRIIWATQVSDIGLVYSGASTAFDGILYAIPHHISAGRPAYATYFEQNKRSASNALRKMFMERGTK